jgi:hypothetical protein
VARMGEGRNVYRVLVGKPEGTRPLGRPRHRWEIGIKIGLREIGLGGAEWIHLAQDRDRWRAVVNAVMNPRVVAPRSYLVRPTFSNKFVIGIKFFCLAINLLNIWSSHGKLRLFCGMRFVTSKL